MHSGARRDPADDPADGAADGPAGELAAIVRSLLDGGWPGPELVGVIRRKGSASAAQVVSDLLADVGARSPAPHADPDALHAAIAILRQVRPLPFHAQSSHTRGLDEDLLRKVRALLSKAESTAFSAEADALTSKAQELITRHALDEAALEGAAGTVGVECRVVGIDPPYAVPKWHVLGAIADANRCRAIYQPSTDSVLVVGHPGDLAAVEVLFTSLLVQATQAMLAEGPVTDRRGRSRTRAFRRSFLIGFADAVGSRLLAANEASAASSSVAATALPVLASRHDAVDAAIDEAFPTLRRRTIGHRSVQGYDAGTDAGRRADIGQRRVETAAGELGA